MAASPQGRRTRTSQPRPAAGPSGAASGAAEGAAAKLRIVIVGGGCAGLSAAWHLLQHDPAGYEITVYERSWRLGGKSASSRDRHGRVLEHGLHVWLGFYENAFRMIRDCYAEVEARRARERDGGSPLGALAHEHFDDAFFAEPHVGVASRSASGEWQAWSGYFPPMPGLPGDPLDEQSNPFTLAGYLARMLGLVKALMYSVLAPPGGEADAGGPRPDGRSTLDQELDFSASQGQASPNVVVERIAQLVRAGALTGAAGLLQAVTIFESILREQAALPLRELQLLQYLEAVATQTRRLLADVVGIDEALRRKTEIIDLVMTTVVGLYRDRVIVDPRGLDALNDIDCRDWMRKHGATHASLESPFVRGLYDLAFAYRNGDKRRPELAAGQGLRGALRMFFTYRGAMAWRMRSGSGDVVFAPLYRVLKARGVRFRLLHALESVAFNDDLSDKAENRVVGLRFSAPADAEKLQAYVDEPLDDGGCWRDADSDALHGLRDRGASVQLGEGDFDAVVFALGKDDFVVAAQPLCKKLERYRSMQRHVRTVGTQCLQVWLNRDLAGLGWRRGPIILAGMHAPFETWADMTHVLASEQGRSGDASAKSLAYFCGALPQRVVDEARRRAEAADGGDGADGAARDARVREQVQAAVRDSARGFLRRDMKALWPAAYGDGVRSVRELLVGPDGAVGASAFAQQHFQANYEGSDRFTMTLPGTLEYRISPLDYSVVNMTIAGDWTRCGFDEGCIEAAVMSGMLAAHAICGSPPLDRIIGYDHP